MGHTGFEQPPILARNSGVAESGGSKSGNIGGRFGDSAEVAEPIPPTTPTPPDDPELATVVAAWPSLPPAIRAGVVAIVKAAGGGK